MGDIMATNTEQKNELAKVRSNVLESPGRKNSAMWTRFRPNRRVARLTSVAGAAGLALVGARSRAQSLPGGSDGVGCIHRYELLAPGSAKFRIVYEVTASTPGATYYFNPIRKGSVATDEHVTDRATGKALQFDVVGERDRACRRRAEQRPRRRRTFAVKLARLCRPRR